MVGVLVAGSIKYLHLKNWRLYDAERKGMAITQVKNPHRYNICSTYLDKVK